MLNNTIRLDHLLALSLLGVGALVLLLEGDRTDGIYLLLILAGYGFGATANGVKNHLGTSASQPNGASSVNSKSHLNDSQDNSSSSVWELADEAYET